MTFFRTKLLSFFLLSFFSMAAPADALRVVSDLWPPYVDQSLPHDGAAMDLITEAFARAGYATEFSIQDWGHALEGANIGVYDVVANLWYTDDRAKVLEFSEPFFVNDLRFVKRKTSQAQFNSLNDLNGLLIGVVRGYAYPEEFEAYTGAVKITQTAFLPALSGLMSGEFDLVIGDKYVIEYNLTSFFPYESKGVVILDKSVGQIPLHIGVSRTNPDHAKIVADFNKAMRDMKQDGTYQTILESHGIHP